MKGLASSLSSKNKFLVFGCGFSGNFFAKTIREYGCTALTSSRTKNNDPNNFLFDSEKNIIPNEEIFENVTHILSCIPPDKNGNDPVLKILKNRIKGLSLDWVGYLSTTGVYGKTNLILFNKEVKKDSNAKKSGLNLTCQYRFLDCQVFRVQGDQHLKQLKIKKSR